MEMMFKELVKVVWIIVVYVLMLLIVMNVSQITHSSMIMNVFRMPLLNLESFQTFLDLPQILRKLQQLSMFLQVLAQWYLDKWLQHTLTLNFVNFFSSMIVPQEEMEKWMFSCHPYKL